MSSLSASENAGQQRSTSIQEDLQVEQNAGNNAMLERDEYRRYGRQMIVPQIGIDGQLSLKSARVLIIGLGGLGCPAALYLAAAGVGKIGLMDGDKVELSNLHRQILHTQQTVGMSKVESAARRLDEVNSTVHCVLHPEDLNPLNALSITEGNYDLILDCTDRPSTRYMISDLAVIIGTPLVSASALKTDGQLLVLNNPPNQPESKSPDENGFCYRCVFPVPPPASSVQACSEAGILGPVVGTMGSLMATEALKILVTPPAPRLQDEAKTMLIYSAFSSVPFRTIRLKGKRAGCRSCSATADITRETLSNGLTDYVAFCSAKATLYPDVPSCTPRQLNPSGPDRQFSLNPALVDVRSEIEFKICHLPNSTNIPLAKIQQSAAALQEYIKNHGQNSSQDILFVCKEGNDSRLATAKALEYFSTGNRGQDSEIKWWDLAGGLKAWREQVDPNFPDY